MDKHFCWLNVSHLEHCVCDSTAWVNLFSIGCRARVASDLQVGQDVAAHWVDDHLDLVQTHGAAL
jgi:hypothetical protein